MRVVPRIIKNIRPGIQQCVPGRFLRVLAESEGLWNTTIS